MNTRDLLIHLSLIDGIGPVAINALMAELPNNFNQAALLQAVRTILSPRKSKLISSALASDELLVEHADDCAANQIKTTTLLDDGYPHLLRTITVPPPVLWYRGQLLPEDYIGCAVVGSRAATVYGKRAVQQLVPTLAQNGIVTVSGGARGIDAAAHRCALENGGVTAAVQGCGLQHTYPTEHESLFADIIARGGVLISPFSPRTPPSRGNFPARNRIIAGLSQVCLVVQAARKSGALITAQYALDEAREVAAVPGPIDEALSAGSNELLRNGAHLVASAEQLADLLPTPMENICEPAADLRSPIEKVLTHAMTMEELAATLSSDIVAVQFQLFDLQLAGKVTQNHAGLWECLL